ncbi:MAG: hypothetical protein LBR22_01920 [Desulfovibrio sp.]|jgi:flagellar biosynthesis/type III secretory pathway protein FliH|nr:hypothetical protein [Desulfovibrio sp.]
MALGTTIQEHRKNLEEIVRQKIWYEAWIEAWIEAWQEGFQEGYRKGLQESLLIFVVNRFPTYPESLKDRIRSMHESDKLKTLMGEIATSRSLEDCMNAVYATLQRQSLGM